MKYKMKKIIALLSLALCLSSCGITNKQIIDTNYVFKKCHLISANKCIEIDTWLDYDNSEQLQLKIKGTNTTIIVSTIEAVLINGTCPYCEKGE